MINLIDKLSKNKSVVFFSLLKYLEIGITSFTTILLATKLSPSQLGISIPIFLYITYANYLSLGINQVILKNYSRYENDEVKEDFIKINLQFLIVACIINVVLSVSVLDFKFAILAAIISSGNLMKSYFMSYFRVTNNIRVLNKNNIIFALFMLLGTYFFVVNLIQYLIIWSLGVLLTFVLYFTSDLNFYKNIIKKLKNIPSKIQIISHLKEGLKLALSGVLATILLTSDRFIINNINSNIELKGAYQLADFIGTGYYLVLTTIVFYFYPTIIKKLRNEISFRDQYIKYLLLSICVLPIMLVLVFGISYYLAPLFFPKYSNLEIYITTNIFLKSCILVVSMLAILYTAKDEEMKYIKSMFLVIVSLFILFLCNSYFPLQYIVTIPIIMSIVLLFYIIVNLIIHGKKKIIY